jgi:hypothetical protein
VTILPGTVKDVGVVIKRERNDVRERVWYIGSEIMVLAMPTLFGQPVPRSSKILLSLLTLDEKTIASRWEMIKSNNSDQVTWRARVWPNDTPGSKFVP